MMASAVVGVLAVGTTVVVIATTTGNDSRSGTLTGTVINGCTIGPRAQCVGANLTGANLTGADLSRANLNSAILTDTFATSYATLSGASLIGANLTGADLYFVNLNGVISSGITGVPERLPPGWAIIDRQLVQEDPGGY